MSSDIVAEILKLSVKGYAKKTLKRGNAIPTQTFATSVFFGTVVQPALDPADKVASELSICAENPSGSVRPQTPRWSCSIGKNHAMSESNPFPGPFPRISQLVEDLVLCGSRLPDRIPDVVNYAVFVRARPLIASRIKVDATTLHLNGEDPEALVRNNEITLAILFVAEPVNRQPGAGVEDMVFVGQLAGEPIVDLHFRTTSWIGANRVWQLSWPDVLRH